MHSEGRPGLLIFIAVFAAVALLRWISNKRDENQAEREAIASVNTKLRTRLAQDGFLLATLLTRAGSEATLQQKEMPPGVEVITHRVQIETLKALGLWNSLPDGVNHLLLLPDGHWSAEQMYDIYSSIETLRCLRWTLGLDEALAPLTSVPKMNYDLAHSIVRHPEALLSGARLKPTWDIRVERNIADVFFSRCYAEIAGRGLIEASGTEVMTWATNLYEAAGRPDVLAGVDTVSEVMTLHCVTSHPSASKGISVFNSSSTSRVILLTGMRGRSFASHTRAVA